MARGEFFSFGDEDLASAPGESWDDIAGSSSVVADAEGLSDWDVDRAAEEAQRSRGDSKTSSSENREPPSLRLYGAVVLVLIAAATLCARIVIGSMAGDDGPTAPPARISPLAVGVAKQGPRNGKATAKPLARVEHDRAERARIRKRRSETRRRAGRRRARRDRSHRQSAFHRPAVGSAAVSTTADPTPPTGTTSAPTEVSPPVPSKASVEPVETPSTGEMATAEFGFEVGR